MKATFSCSRRSFDNCINPGVYPLRRCSNKQRPIPISKKCRLCKTVKLLNQFEVDDKTKDKHSTICKDLHKLLYVIIALSLLHKGQRVEVSDIEFKLST